MNNLYQTITVVLADNRKAMEVINQCLNTAEKHEQQVRMLYMYKVLSRCNQMIQNAYRNRS